MTRAPRAPFWVLVAMVLAMAPTAGCRSRAARPSVASTAPGAPIPSSALVAGTEEAPPRPLRRCFGDQPTWVEPSVSSLLDRAADLFDADDVAGALACAEEAARQAPRSVEAHHDRAAALIRAGRLDEARDALALALALDPDDPETLEASADLYINQLPASSDRSTIGLEHARRGFRRVAGRDAQRAARLALLEGQALIDLGRASEAVRRLDAALAVMPKLGAAQYEKGVALFELCRFEEARRAFEKVLASSPDHVHALYHLGLIEERIGDPHAAEARLAEASLLDPGSFPPPPAVGADDFAARVRRAVAALPTEVRADLLRARVETAELPDLDDLVAEKPPLSPTILGLFRGLPLDWDQAEDRRAQAGRLAKGRRGPGAGPTASAEASAGSSTACAPPERTIVLYRRNLLRSVRDASELDQAITRTLLHEVGHLRGEDDGSLRDRGLE